MATLKGWKEFCELRRIGIKLCDEKTNINLNRFRARFKVAKRFQMVMIDGCAERTLRGYSAGIRLLLCYTAGEMLGQTIGAKITGWTIFAPSLVNDLRSACKNFHNDENAMDSPALRLRLSEFVDGKSDDLRVVATSLRVMMAHGHFTPFGTKANNTKNVNAIHGLGTVLLEQSELRFNDWFAAQIATMEK